MTVALLAIGLFAAGVGTLLFLSTSLVEGVDTQVDALAQTDVSGPLLNPYSDGGKLAVSRPENAPTTEYYVAVYEPENGELLATAGGRGSSPPIFPETFPLDTAKAMEQQIVTLRSEDGESEFRATVVVQELSGTSILYSQMVAVPLSTVSRTLTSYLGIYTVLAMFILIIGAFATRWLVTLAFRSLGEVESTADAIVAGDFGQRMTADEPVTTEVGRLKTAINAMLGRVDAAISERDATVGQMRRFIGDASHELRTPLVTVRGYAELYRMGAITGDEDVARAMNRIESEAERMGLLVEDLLALARLDERRDVVVGPVDLRPIAGDAALDVRATAPHRTVKVIDTTAEPPPIPYALPATGPQPGAVPRKRQTPSAIARAGASLALLRRRPRPVPATRAAGVGEPTIAPPPAVPEPTAPDAVAPIVLGDENRIRQVVTNLLGNARRFTADDSPIELRVGIDQATRQGWIEVVDHGEGVPDQIKEKIFQRFWRADTSRARETGGTGLGLSIVASIVETLQGSIQVLDTPGGGATFRVGFPLTEGRHTDQLSVDTQPLPVVGDER